MNEPTRREERQAKRELKRDGVKHRRRELKRQLAENPDEAAPTDADDAFGRYRTAPLNGKDRDPTRRRDPDR